MKKVISERTGIPIGLDAAVLCWSPGCAGHDYTVF
ncbi:hypothetical protein RCH21_001865 [Arthrobacter sp. PL16]|nr:hypothetical protein [Arthrobacter sp. PL16]